MKRACSLQTKTGKNIYMQVTSSLKNKRYSDENRKPDRFKRPRTLGGLLLSFLLILFLGLFFNPLL